MSFEDTVPFGERPADLTKLSRTLIENKINKMPDHCFLQRSLVY